MNARAHLFGLTVLLFLTAAAAAAPTPMELRPVYPGLALKRPTTIAIPNDGTQRMFLVEQRGRILLLPRDRARGQAEVFLDLTHRNLIDKAFEEGLIGLAFHPKFKTNHKFYVYYTMQDPKRTVIAEFTTDAANANRASMKSTRVLLEIPQPFWNHNSGNLLFGPDGNLLICVGDGGKADDIKRLAQNPKALNGKILRIDVDRRDKGLGYAIPRDNPFRDGRGGMRPEIYTLGMRNPWGIYYDKKTELLWCADVGQNAWEEINLIESGANYGWSFREGFVKFVKRDDAPPAGSNFTDPIHVYGRKDGISITGGVVYRGTRIPSLREHYIYGDWGTGTIWGLRYNSKTQEVAVNHKLFKRPDTMKKFKPSAFCYDDAGELMVLSWSGQIYEVWPQR
jgi:glucose/arabinose dehydrogenase